MTVVCGCATRKIRSALACVSKLWGLRAFVRVEALQLAKDVVNPCRAAKAASAGVNIQKCSRLFDIDSSSSVLTKG